MERRTSSLSKSLFGGQLFRGATKANKTLQPPNIEELLSSMERCDWSKLEELLRAHWSESCPVIFAPNSEKPWDLTVDDTSINTMLFNPLAAVMCADTKAVNLEDLANQLGLNITKRKPGQICGHVFKSGEPTYTCRECANDPTCVMCYDCFSHSGHRNHRYKMHTSAGSGYCDCGDDEAWSKDISCDLHKPLTPEEEEKKMETDDDELSPVVLTRLERICSIILRYCVQMVCWQQYDTLPDNLMPVDNLEHSFQTILFNDETHTYDGVIRALELAIHCTEEQAMLLATIVDKEGRSSVRAGLKDSCEKAKLEIQRKTAKDTNPRTEKRGPLVVEVMESCIVAHQHFAIRLLAWLNTAAQQFPPLSRVIAKILIDEELEESDSSLAMGMMLKDMHLWKAARSNFHQLLMGTVLMDFEYKQKFSRVFTKCYPKLIQDYIVDDHDHTMSIISLTVQMYTVPTIARLLMTEENAMAVILKALLDKCDEYKGNRNKYDFSRRSYPAVLRRALIMVHDVKYLLNSIPSPSDWNDKLRQSFRNGCDVLLEILTKMQGMDEVKRQVGEHQIWESEWETAFNIQLRIQSIMTLVQAWAATDPEVLSYLLTKCIEKLAAEIKRTGADKTEAVEVSNVMCTCVLYDVSSNPISIHLPLCRMIAGLCVHSDMDICETLLTYTSRDIEPKGALIELPLRVMVMNGQTQAQMWRRNGYALLNQIHNYYSPLCRTEMYDKDIVMLQIGASLMCGDEFVIRLLHKYGLHRWAQTDYEEQRSADELSKQVVTLAEEMLHLFIVIVGERWLPGIGQCTRLDMLRREVVHILSKGPTPYSKIAKRIPEDPLLERLSTEDAVKSVANFKKPYGTNAGTFELKTEYLETYNPFFYHFSKTDFSQAEQEQQKVRKNVGKEMNVCAPPECPKFVDKFSSIDNILKCDVMLQMLTLILQRTARRSRVSSDGLTHRALYLIGMALNEEIRDSGKFPFTKSAIKWAEARGEQNLLKLMEKLTGTQEAAAVTDLLLWTVARFNKALELHSESPKLEAMDDDTQNSEKDENVEKEEKKKRQKIAEENRKKAMEQMNRLQKQFMKQHKDLLDNDITNEENQREEAEFCCLLNDNTFPIAVGPNRSEIKEIPTRKVTCILCQETNEVCFDGKPIVCAAFIQKSTLFSKSKDTEFKLTDSYDPTFMPSDLKFGVHVSTCAHTMHWQCWQQYFTNLFDREQRRSRQQLFFSQRTLDVDKGEYLCPLCKRLSNAAMPLLPNLSNMKTMQGYWFKPNPNEDDEILSESTEFHRWIISMRSAIESDFGKSPVAGSSRQKHRSGSRTNLQRKRSHSATSESVDIGQSGALVDQPMSSSVPSEPTDLWNEPSDSEEETQSDQEMANNAAEVESGFDLSTEARNLIRHLLPHSMVAKLTKFIRPTSIIDENVPQFFHNWEMVRTFARQVYSHGLGMIPETPSNRICFVNLQAAAYTLRCVAAVLRQENKPLFGAFSTRTKDCLYVLTRFAVCSQFLCFPEKLRTMATRLLSVFVSEDNARTTTVVQLDMFSTLFQLIVSVGWLNDFERHQWTIPNGDDHFILRLSLTGYLYQTLITWPTQHASQSATTDDCPIFQKVWSSVRHLLAYDQPMDTEDVTSSLTNHVRGALIDFLRPTALLFHAITQVPPPEALKDPSIDEFEPLCRYLGLPTKFADLIEYIVDKDLYQNWSRCEKLRELALNDEITKQPIKPNLLIDLPEEFGRLINRAVNFTCPILNTEESRAPTLCLVCGQMLCSQSYCCQRTIDNKEQIGACNYHMLTCSANSGIFLRVRDSQVVLLTVKNRGSFRAAPYVDEFGETDQGFRRGNPLHLNKDLFARLQHLWFHHSIPEEVINQYEIDHRNVAIDWQHL